MPATILVCDDKEALRDLARAALADGDYTIVEAHDGEESLELARQVRPDLIVLDLVMPGRSGLDVLAELRRDADVAGTPIILCTASRQSLDDSLAAELGAHDYLPKPFSPTELASIVEELLADRR